MRKESDGLIDKINIRLPQSLKDALFTEAGSNEGIGNFQIIDMPGQEDSLFLDRIQQYISYHKNNIVPIFIIDLTSGSFELSSHNFIRALYVDCGVAEISFVFTKFHNMIQNIMVQTQNEDPSFDGLEERQQQEVVIKRCQQLL